MDWGADYVTEREAFAIRGMSFGGWIYDTCNMVIKFKDGAGALSVPVDIVRRYTYDWEKSGLWSLPATKADSDGDDGA